MECEKKFVCLWAGKIYTQKPFFYLFMHLPDTKNKSIQKLSQVFNSTSATYKFYWFIAILEIYNREHSTRIRFEEIIIRMIANAWYPIHYFRLSFGMQDKLAEYIYRIHEITGIPIDADKETIQQQLLNTVQPEIKRMINNLTLNVPYRFLSPWIPFTNNVEVVEKSNLTEMDVPYALQMSMEKEIVIQPFYADYFQSNYRILLDFIYWNLSQYLQIRNPNVPDLTGKLVKPLHRSSLSTQRAYWELALEQMGSLSCIYTGKKLEKSGYDLDHFIPWSFVAHDLQWNLIPVDSSINSSKSNKLPDLQYYIEKLALTEKAGLEAIYHIQPHHKRLEDFTVFGHSAAELSAMQQMDFTALYRKTLTPMIQIAENMGFENDWRYVL